MLGDTLTLLDGEQDEEPYGLFPPLMGQGGLTPAAEMWNGRLAMLGPNPNPNPNPNLNPNPNPNPNQVA